MECSHIVDNVKVEDFDAEETRITKSFICSECGVEDQNWMCLQCGVISCGRYVNGHAKLHAETLDHQICMSCDVYSVYCYKCDDYISNDSNQQTIHKIRQCMMRQSNEINNGVNSNNEHSEESKDGSESNSINITLDDTNSILSHAPNNSPDDSSTVSDVPASSLNDYTNINQDFSEIKSSKIVKSSEETVRSLRPRCRKRTHSSDNNSTDNSTNLTCRSKEKKVSPCNGKVREKKIVGLKNLGNTCFMNAVLQSLNNIQEFSCYFSKLPSLEAKTNGRKVYHSRSYTRQEMQDVVMAEELRKVLINLNSGCGKTGAISPECLFLVIWKVVPRFRGYQQQDAHEFLRYMLDRLHTELQQLLPGDRAEVSMMPRTSSASIVTAVFGGMLQSEVRCLACGTESKKLDPFLDLSLELPEGGRHEGPVALTDCLASFVQVEELADTERYFCSSCKCKQKSTKQFRIRRLPNVLCLHLKRFRWHNCFRTKVDTAISFPLSALDMSRYALGARGALYDLAAAVVHHGSGAGAGHYTAFAASDGRWLHFNDHSVRAAAAPQVAACKPYILFYIRRA